MKSFKLALPLMIVAALTTGCASGVKYAAMKEAMPTVKEGEGRVYFYRASSMFGAAIQPDISLNGTVVGTSKPGGFFYVDRAAGDFKAMTGTEVERTLSFSLGVREVKYIKTSPSMGLMVGRINFELVDSAVAEAELPDLSFTGEPEAKK
ncbi:DUF2846 domain-containing protein [Chitinivorax sp. B]|uniref:DUF2846 domain-containing protein n=1 Tax=Chitinivorax sp. B TaxID=2502235 RepID=UPI0010F7CAA8|nr:DUF2846 domain-containing protein [Chitinivorax sp. B]